ncbi:MAG: rhodanese-like domain-containing protein [Gammaproteobacteria bacterium]|nr:rhodanese-like domain-containing protein [Gammaproteobacteria bacterium]
MTQTVVNEVNPPEAWEILQTDPSAILIDVRTSMEFEYVGHPLNAVNIPWMEAPDWQVDPAFSNKVRELLKHRPVDKDIEEVPVLAICRSGKRSEAAARCLMEDGFKQVYNVSEGFEGDRDGQKHRSHINGWRYHNLPWEQS